MSYPLRPWCWVVLCGLAAVLVGCGKGPDPEPPPPAGEPAETSDGPAWFEDVTAKAGVDFVHDCGPTEGYRMPQIVGSGCAAHDLDGDGKADLLFLTNAGPQSASKNKLYRQRPDGTFEDVSAGSGLDFPGFNMGVAVGDYDDDGKPDVAVTMFVGVRLFRNLGGMKFQDVTEAAGIKNPYWGASAAFFDFDRDGRLDLFVANYLDYTQTWHCRSPGGQPSYCSPSAFPGTPSALYRNLGGGKFEDVSRKSGIAAVLGPGLGVVCADFTGDGWPDVFVANDGQPNRMWENLKDGTFREAAGARGVAYTQMGAAFAGMGIAVGDLDNDGLLDLYVTHLTSESNTLWKQGPRGIFRDATAGWGLAATRRRGTGFGTLAVDFDHDGFLDLAIVNGRVNRDETPGERPGVAPFWVPYAERNQVLANTGTGFKDTSANHPALCGYYTVGRGLACGDLDGDGAPDLVVTAIGEKARLLRNVAPARGHWLAVRCTDPARGGRDALGAEVSVTAGGVRRVRLVASTHSYMAANPPTAHFGLGAAAVVDSVDVIWPDGTTERFPCGPADRTVECRKGTGNRK